MQNSQDSSDGSQNVRKRYAGAQPKASETQSVQSEVMETESSISRGTKKRKLTSHIY
jgi:hypothetical protein